MTVDEIQQGPLPRGLCSRWDRQLSKNQRTIRELVVTGPEQSTSGSVIESDWGPGGVSQQVAPRRQTLLLRETEGQADGDPSGPGKPAEPWAPDILVESRAQGRGC